MNHLENILNDAIEKCQTHAHRAKAYAGHLRNNGFSGSVIADLIFESEQALKYAHLYQAYINVKGIKNEMG